MKHSVILVFTLCFLYSGFVLSEDKQDKPVSGGGSQVQKDVAKVKDSEGTEHSNNGNMPLYGQESSEKHTNNSLDEQMKKNAEEIKNGFAALDSKIKRIEELDAEISNMIQNHEIYEACSALASLKKDIEAVNLNMSTSKDQKVIEDGKKELSLYNEVYSKEKEKLDKGGLFVKFCES